MTTGCIAAAYGWFNGIPQVAPVCTPPNNGFIDGSTRVQIQNGISTGSAIFAQLMAERHYTLQWATLSPSKLPLPMVESGPHRIHDSMCPSEPITQTASRLVQPFLHSSPQSVPILYNRRPLPSPKLVPSHGVYGPHVKHGSFGSPESITKMASPSVQPFLQGSQL